MIQTTPNNPARLMVFRRGLVFKVLGAICALVLCLTIYKNHDSFDYAATKQYLLKGLAEQEVRASIEQELRNSITQELRGSIEQELKANIEQKPDCAPSLTPATSKDGIVEEEVILPGNVRRYTRVNEAATPELLWLLMTYNNVSWQKMPDKSMRNIDSFHDLAVAQYKTENSSIALLTSSEEEYESYKRSIVDRPFARVTIFLHPGYRGTGTTYGNRHDNDKQYRRRGEMAKLRNYLMLKSFKEEKHMVWIDADVWRIDPGLVRKVIQHVDTQSEYGIFTVLCKYVNGGNYDRNAWAGTRKGPRGWDLTEEEIKNGEEKKQGRHLITELIKGTKGNDIVPLDNVGGTFLYMRGDLVPQGLSFPH